MRVPTLTSTLAWEGFDSARTLHCPLQCSWRLDVCGQREACAQLVAMHMPHGVFASAFMLLMRAWHPAGIRSHVLQFSVHVTRTRRFLSTAASATCQLSASDVDRRFFHELRFFRDHHA